MNRNLLLARANIRKAKGQTIAIVVLVLLSSIMMNLWLMLATDYKQNFERCHDKLNDGHISLAAYTADETYKEFMADTIKNSSEVTEYHLTDAFCALGSLEYNGGDITNNFVILEKEAAVSRNVGTFEITEEGAPESGVYLSLLYNTEGNYSVGDKIELTIGSENYEYTVCGFFNNTMMGSHNCGMLSFLLTEDKFHELAEKSSIPKATLASIRIKDKSKSEQAEAALIDEITQKYPDIPLTSNHYKMITTSRYVSQMVCSGILSALAFFILLIGVVVISSNVANYIQEDMQNLGALKALGYTSRQLIRAVILQFLGITATAAALGIAISYCIFPPLNDMMIAQTGIPYDVNFLPIPCLITIGFISAIVAAAVYWSARRIKNLETITAIRQGIATHNFRKNRVPLEKTMLPLHPALAMKTTLSGRKQNITTCITTLVLSLILVFSSVLFQNIIIDMQPFVNMIAGEMADSCITVGANREDEFLKAMDADSRVEKIYVYANGINVGLEDGSSSVIATISDDYSKLNNQTSIIEGRFPLYDNEVAIAPKYAKEHGLKVGSEIRLSATGTTYTYLITGFVQMTNQLGKDCAFTREGYEKMTTLQNVSYYINLTEGTNIDKFNDEVCEHFGSDISATLNIVSILEGTSSVYVALIEIIVAAVLILSGIIIVFVMYLLVRTLLNKKKRDYGILKALGYTTGQLVLQTAMSFMPSIIFSAALGIFISMQIINPLFAVFLSGIGIVKSTFPVPVGFNIIAGIGLVLFAFAAACLMSLRVRKITPRELLSGE